MLVTVSKHIGTQWKKLAVSLQIPYVEDIDARLPTNELKMMKCFEKKSNNVSWKDLKTQLLKLNRDDIVDIICQESCVTVGKV